MIAILVRVFPKRLSSTEQDFLRARQGGLCGLRLVWAAELRRGGLVPGPREGLGRAAVTGTTELRVGQGGLGREFKSSKKFRSMSHKSW